MVPRSRIPLISGANLQDIYVFRVGLLWESVWNPLEGTGDRIRQSVMAGSCRFPTKPDKSDDRIWSPEYCFHEIYGRSWNWTVLDRIV
ncbi:hypothetical protein I4U23_027394 [Adineta vaga]|nr:hypothetical protein I4U23_027394 [Adineta vaga]